MLIIFGKEHLRNNFWEMFFGAVGIFVCKTGRNGAHFSQKCWGHDVKSFLHPFDVDTLEELLGNNVLGRMFGAIGILCVKQYEMLPIFLRIVGATSVMSRCFAPMRC